MPRKIENQELSTCPNGCDTSFSCEESDWSDDCLEYRTLMVCDGDDCEYAYEEVFTLTKLTPLED